MPETVHGVPKYPMPRGRCPFDPPPELRRLQQEEPVSRVEIWDGSTPWLFTRHNDVRAMLTDPRSSANTDIDGYPHFSAGALARRRVAKSFLNMDDPEHAAQRRLLTVDFMVRKIETLRPRIQRILDDLIDDMLAGPKPTDLVQALALPLPLLMICELLGVPYADRAMFHRISNALVDHTATPAESEAAIHDLIDYLSALVLRKNADPADDLLSRLALEQLRTGAMTAAQIAVIGQILLVAGHETSANMIALGTLVLLEHPVQLEELRTTDDPALIANAAEELLRYLSVVQSGRRRVALEDMEVGGQVVRKGEGMIGNTDIANRDQTAFPNGDELDLRRKARHHVAFGSGVHQCLGQPLARVELQVVYGTLYRRIPTLALAEPVEVLRFKNDMLVYGVHELPVTW
jgi:cytochrome P450